MNELLSLSNFECELKSRYYFLLPIDPILYLGFDVDGVIINLG